jgi:16S rRNA (cytosine967-C5)-methyltransferase
VSSDGTDDEVSVHAVARVLAGERAEQVVPEVLRAHRALDDEGRGRVARRVYGTAVLRARLAFIARVDVGDARALVEAYVRLEEGRDGAAVDVTWPTDPCERMCVERSAPAFMVRDLIDALGAKGADAFFIASNEPAPATLRTNALKTTRDALRERLRDEGIVAQPSPLAGAALVVQGRANLFGTAAWREGWFEVQDASSQVCVERCGARPGDIVIDLCAGRGGKTLALAASMHDEGALFVNDIDARALADMRPRLTRAGVMCVRALPAHGAPQADVVLVDAPCSAWGPLRRSPDLRWTQTLDELASLPGRQRALLERAVALVKPGGRVVYATCTLRRAENDDVVAAALAHSALVLSERRVLLPHIDGSDGFFIAVMRAA